MKKILFFTFFLVLGWVMAPTHGISALIYYDASGSVTDKDRDNLPITGGMYIENQLWEWSTEKPVNYSADIPGYEPNVGINHYGLSIKSFDFKVGEYDFSGSGYFYISLYRCPDPASDVTFDYSEWYLWGSQESQWHHWGNSFSVAVPIQIDEEISLADEIDLGWLMHWDIDCLILGDPYDAYPDLDLTLVRQDSIPVPEPSTGILFGIGIAGMFIYRLRGSASRT